MLAIVFNFWTIELFYANYFTLFDRQYLSVISFNDKFRFFIGYINPIF